MRTVPGAQAEKDDLSMPENAIHLTGYFDRNFGDDMMMKLIVRDFPEITFLVENTVDTPLLSEPNVVRKDHETCRRFPKLVVIGSGFMINTKAALKTELLSFVRGKHPGDYCLGCNMEPLNTPLKRFLISRKMNRFKLITCRDRASYDWLQKNTRKPELHYRPDILFSIPDAWLPQPQTPDKLGISMMHRAGDQADCAYYRCMAEIADEWVRETGKNVILMALDTGKEDDVFACQSVKALMEFGECVEIVAHKEGTEIPAAFAQCEKIITARLHASVLALRMGIPLYPLVFREKVRNMLYDLHFPFPMSDLDDIDPSSLRDFIKNPQDPHRLEADICVRAGEHAALFKQQLAR